MFAGDPGTFIILFIAPNGHANWFESKPTGVGKTSIIGRFKVNIDSIVSYWKSEFVYCFFFLPTN